MPLPAINYELTDSDRRGLAVSFGIDLARVPSRVTGGRLDFTTTMAGVMFNEMIGGHRIALRFEGRPILVLAAAAQLAAHRSKVA